MKWLERWETKRYGETKKKRKKGNKAKIGDTEGEAETIRRMLSPHHYFNTHSPSTDSSSFFFFLFELPLIFSFYYSSSLFQSLSLGFITLFLSLSVVQTNEAWNIRHQDTERVICRHFCVCVCVGGKLCTCIHVCMCVCVCSLLALKPIGSTSRSGR